ncbi:MAG: hypothetical protein IPI69_00845 [Bacteroidales bacterium]|nr:hypothetical protein [Bacteroidales bacterium]
MIRKLLYLAIIILLLPACRGRNEGGHAEFTIAALKGPSAMGMIRLIDSLNSSPGHPVEVQILNEPLQVRKMMLDGTADFAILPTTMASILYNKGLKYKLIGIPCWGHSTWPAATPLSAAGKISGTNVFMLWPGE